MFGEPDEHGNVLLFHQLDPEAEGSEELGNITRDLRLHCLLPARQLPETYPTFEDLHIALLGEIWVGCSERLVCILSKQSPEKTHSFHYSKGLSEAAVFSDSRRVTGPSR